MLDWKPLDDAAKNGDEVILNTGAVAYWGDLNAADSEWGTVQHEEFWCWLISDGKSDPIHYRPYQKITHYCLFAPPELANRPSFHGCKCDCHYNAGVMYATACCGPTLLPHEKRVALARKAEQEGGGG